jgi:endonuclease YncB( thermonuclease family)
LRKLGKTWGSDVGKCWGSEGIDAPEHGQAFGTKSKENLSVLVAGKEVVVEYAKYDRYRRILGKVHVNGEDVNLELIEVGQAWHFKKYEGEQSVSDRVKYSDAEREARKQKRCGKTPIRFRPGSIGRPSESI